MKSILFTVTHRHKKAWNTVASCLFHVSKALALPNPEEQTTTMSTLYYILAPRGGGTIHKYCTNMIQSCCMYILPPSDGYNDILDIYSLPLL